MSTLAVDIETASPDKEPSWDDFDDTSYFECVAIALGYQSARDEPPEMTVLFRDGGWDLEHTATLLRDAVNWCQERNADRILTYNGSGFDVVHLRGWAANLVKNGVWKSAVDHIEGVLTNHSDLKHRAVDRHGYRLPDWKNFPKFEDFCEWEHIDTPRFYYDDYQIDPELRTHPAIDKPYVENRHIGQVLGKAYVESVDAGETNTREFKELEQLLRDYALADIEPLFALDNICNTSDI